MVIYPDGTVDFDPAGGVSIGNATIEALEEAIRMSGARKPYDLVGTATMPSGESIVTFNLLINGEEYTPYEMGGGGLFGLHVLLKPDTTYDISAFKNGSYSNGLTTFDMIKIRKHLLGIEVFDASWKYLASDANRSGTIDTLDIIQLTKLVIAISDDLPNNDPWGFVKTDYTFSVPDDPYDEFYAGDAGTYHYVAGSGIPLDFIGVKIGDINESADAD